MRRLSFGHEFESLFLSRRHSVIAGTEWLEDVELLTHGLGQSAFGHLKLANVIAPKKKKLKKIIVYWKFGVLLTIHRRKLI